MTSEEHEVVRYSVPVSTALDAEVRKRMREGGFSSVAEYIRTAVRADLERARKERLDVLLLEGLESGDGVEVSPEYWEQRRRELNARLAQRRREEGV
jgi:antitoxin ParD1/3/4